MTRLADKRGPLLLYAVGSVGTGLFSSVTGILLLFFMTDTLGIAAATAGLVLFIPKFWDVVFDPLVGIASDRTHSRWGRRQPYFCVHVLGRKPDSVDLVFGCLLLAATAAMPLWVAVARRFGKLGSAIAAALVFGAALAAMAGVDRNTPLPLF